MSAYYNEHDRFAAAWLRELIKAGLIADGEVDERDIQDVCADDVRGFTQCHFFAGIGGWSYALRLAGWPDDRSVWTGSCPCQPFSAAGKQKGGADDRHLWPDWARLIGECRPVTIFGEQVESAIAHGWLDAVFDDLEGQAYACGPAGLPSASVGACDLRQRLWFVANAKNAERWGEQSTGEPRRWRGGLTGSGALRVADAEHAERWPIRGHRGNGCDGQDSGREEAHGEPGTRGEVRELAYAERAGLSHGWSGPVFQFAGIESGEVSHMADPQSRGQRVHRSASGIARHIDERGANDMGDPASERLEGCPGEDVSGARRRDEGRAVEPSSPWADLEWLPCRDGKARPTQPGLFPLAHGVSGRVGRLRGYGNAINPWVAAEVIRAYMSITERPDR